MKLCASCIRSKTKSLMVSSAASRQKPFLVQDAFFFFNGFHFLSHQTRNRQNQYILISSEHTDGGGGGGERRRELEEDGHADAQTRGPENVLSMFL